MTNKIQHNYHKEGKTRCQLNSIYLWLLRLDVLSSELEAHKHYGPTIKIQD